MPQVTFFAVIRGIDKSMAACHELGGARTRLLTLPHHSLPVAIRKWLPHALLTVFDNLELPAIPSNRWACFGVICCCIWSDEAPALSSGVKLTCSSA